MKKSIINYLLYIYNTYIEDDVLDITKKWAKPFVKTIIYTRNVYIWCLSIIFFPILVLDMKIREIINSNKLKNI